MLYPSFTGNSKPLYSWRPSYKLGSTNQIVQTTPRKYGEKWHWWRLPKPPLRSLGLVRLNVWGKKDGRILTTKPERVGQSHLDIQFLFLSSYHHLHILQKYTIISESSSPISQTKIKPAHQHSQQINKMQIRRRNYNCGSSWKEVEEMLVDNIKPTTSFSGFIRLMVGCTQPLRMACTVEKCRKSYVRKSK